MMVNISLAKQKAFWATITIVYIFLAFLWRSTPFYWDTATFLFPAAESIFYTQDIFSYLHMTDYPHTFGLPLLLALALNIPFDYFAIFHLISALFSLLCLYSIYYLLKRFKTDEAAYYTVLLTALTPVFLAQTNLVYFEIPGLALRFLSLSFLIGNQTKLFVTFLLMAFLVRFENGPVITITCLAYLLFHFISTKKVHTLSFVGLLFSILLAVLWLVVHKLEVGWWLYSPERYFDENHFHTLKQALSYIFFWQGRWFTSILLAIFSCYFFIEKKRLTVSSTHIVLLTQAFTTFIIAVGLGYFLPRYTLPVILTYYAVISIMMCSLITKRLIRLLVVTASLFIFFFNRNTCFSSNFEDCLVVVDLLTLKKQASQYLETLESKTITTDYMESNELQNPKLGFVAKKLSAEPFDEKNPQPGNYLYVSPTASYHFTQFSSNEGELLQTFSYNDLSATLYVLD